VLLSGFSFAALTKDGPSTGVTQIVEESPNEPSNIDPHLHCAGAFPNDSAFARQNGSDTIERAQAQYAHALDTLLLPQARADERPLFSGTHDAGLQGANSQGGDLRPEAVPGLAGRKVAPVHVPKQPSGKDLSSSKMGSASRATGMNPNLTEVGKNIKGEPVPEQVGGFKTLEGSGQELTQGINKLNSFNWAGRTEELKCKTPGHQSLSVSKNKPSAQVRKAPSGQASLAPQSPNLYAYFLPKHVPTLQGSAGTQKNANFLATKQNANQIAAPDPNVLLPGLEGPALGAQQKVKSLTHLALNLDEDDSELELEDRRGQKGRGTAAQLQKGRLSEEEGMSESSSKELLMWEAKPKQAKASQKGFISRANTGIEGAHQGAERDGRFKAGMGSTREGRK
jgi:hypothetical protein